MYFDDENLLIDGEIVDSYGGDFTYRDVAYEKEGGKIKFYERFYGVEEYEEDWEEITDESDIRYYMDILNLK